MRQLVRFGAIGIVSTLAYLVLYSALRLGLDAQLANAVALLTTAVANTAANRRLTFGLSGRHHAGRHQLQGLFAFALGLGITSGALALLHALQATPSRAVELICWSPPTWPPPSSASSSCASVCSTGSGPAASAGGSARRAITSRYHSALAWASAAGWRSPRARDRTACCSRGPLEVVQQRPGEVAAQVDAGRDRGQGGPEVTAQVLHPPGSWTWPSTTSSSNAAPFSVMISGTPGIVAGEPGEQVDRARPPRSASPSPWSDVPGRGRRCPRCPDRPAWPACPTRAATSPGA